MKVTDYLAKVKHEADKHGFVSAKVANLEDRVATGKLVFNDPDSIVATDEDKEFVTGLLKWIESIDSDMGNFEYSSYQDNLCGAIYSGKLTARNCNLIASAIPSYQRVLDERNKAVSTHYVGEVGEKIELRVTVAEVKEVTFQKEVAVLYGCRYVEDHANLVKFMTSDNAELVWFTRVDIEKLPEVGADLVIKGTVKNHKEFRGNLSTGISRVKWESTPEFYDEIVADRSEREAIEFFERGETESAKAYAESH